VVVGLQRLQKSSIHEISNGVYLAEDKSHPRLGDKAVFQVILSKSTEYLEEDSSEYSSEILKTKSLIRMG
jgi:hypothetical protein